MPIWLINFIPYLWKFLKHWGVYILITLILVGGPYLLYRKGFNDGYKDKVCPPTYQVGEGGVANTYNYNSEDFKWLGIRGKLLWLKVNFGY